MRSPTSRNRPSRTAVACTKMSSPPPSGAMKPKALPSNQFLHVPIIPQRPRLQVLRGGLCPSSTTSLTGSSLRRSAAQRSPQSHRCQPLTLRCQTHSTPSVRHHRLGYATMETAAARETHAASFASGGMVAPDHVIFGRRCAFWTALIWSKPQWAFLHPRAWPPAQCR